MVPAILVTVLPLMLAAEREVRLISKASNPAARAAYLGRFEHRRGIAARLPSKSKMGRPLRRRGVQQQLLICGLIAKTLASLRSTPAMPNHPPLAASAGISGARLSAARSRMRNGGAQHCVKQAPRG